MYEAILYENDKDSKVACTACKHKCTIPEGHAGICGVRYNDAGKLYLLVYGKAVAHHVDPIEKKPLYHFLPKTTAYSIGTVGCNFHCKFCQNWDIAMATQDPREKLKEKVPLMGDDMLPNDVVEECISSGSKTIAYTYNEPSIFAEYAHDTAKIAEKKGLKNIFVSNGYDSTEELNLMSGLLDAINIDLKSFNEDFYKKICGGKLQNVLDTIVEVHSRGIWMEITTLLIPGHNDSDEELRNIAKFIAGIDATIPWHVTAFSPCYKMLDVKPTPPSSLYRAYDIGKEEGLQYVYVGNILDEEHSTTHCPECSTPLISRNGYSVVVEDSFDKGKCKTCGKEIPGVWS